MNQDAEHLKLLAVFHFVVAGLAALFACFPIIHLAIGILFLVAPGIVDAPDKAEFPRVFMGIFFVAIASTFILLGWIMAFLVYRAGRCLQHRKRYNFCIAIAGLMCIFMPFGTVLGVFTIIVLLRPTVKVMFEEAELKPL